MEVGSMSQKPNKERNAQKQEMKNEGAGTKAVAEEPRSSTVLESSILVDEGTPKSDSKDIEQQVVKKDKSGSEALAETAPEYSLQEDEGQRISTFKDVQRKQEVEKDDTGTKALTEERSSTLPEPSLLGEKERLESASKGQEQEAEEHVASTESTHVPESRGSSQKRVEVSSHKKIGKLQGKDAQKQEVEKESTGNEDLADELRSSTVLESSILAYKGRPKSDYKGQEQETEEVKAGSETTSEQEPKVSCQKEVGFSPQQEIGKLTDVQRKQEVEKAETGISAPSEGESSAAPGSFFFRDKKRQESASKGQQRETEEVKISSETTSELESAESSQEEVEFLPQEKIGKLTGMKKQEVEKDESGVAVLKEEGSLTESSPLGEKKGQKSTSKGQEREVDEDSGDEPELESKAYFPGEVGPPPANKSVKFVGRGAPDNKRIKATIKEEKDVTYWKEKLKDGCEVVLDVCLNHSQLSNFDDLFFLLKRSIIQRIEMRGCFNFALDTFRMLLVVENNKQVSEQESGQIHLDICENPMDFSCIISLRSLLERGLISYLALPEILNTYYTDWMLEGVKNSSFRMHTLIMCGAELNNELLCLLCRILRENKVSVLLDLRNCNHRDRYLDEDDKEELDWEAKENSKELEIRWFDIQDSPKPEKAGSSSHQGLKKGIDEKLLPTSSRVSPSEQKEASLQGDILHTRSMLQGKKRIEATIKGEKDITHWKMELEDGCEIVLDVCLNHSPLANYDDLFFLLERSIIRKIEMQGCFESPRETHEMLRIVEKNTRMLYPERQDRIHLDIRENPMDYHSVLALERLLLKGSISYLAAPPYQYLGGDVNHSYNEWMLQSIKECHIPMETLIMHGAELSERSLVFLNDIICENKVTEFLDFRNSSLGIFSSKHYMEANVREPLGHGPSKPIGEQSNKRIEAVIRKEEDITYWRNSLKDDRQIVLDVCLNDSQLSNYDDLFFLLERSVIRRIEMRGCFKSPQETHQLLRAVESRVLTLHSEREDRIHLDIRKNPVDFRCIWRLGYLLQRGSISYLAMPQNLDELYPEVILEGIGRSDIPLQTLIMRGATLSRMSPIILRDILVRNKITELLDLENCKDKYGCPSDLHGELIFLANSFHEKGPEVRWWFDERDVPKTGSPRVIKHSSYRPTMKSIGAPDSKRIEATIKEENDVIYWKEELEDGCEVVLDVCLNHSQLSNFDDLFFLLERSIIRRIEMRGCFKSSSETHKMLRAVENNKQVSEQREDRIHLDIRENPVDIRSICRLGYLLQRGSISYLAMPQNLDELYPEVILEGIGRSDIPLQTLIMRGATLSRESHDTFRDILKRNKITELLDLENCRDEDGFPSDFLDQLFQSANRFCKTGSPLVIKHSSSRSAMKSIDSVTTKKQNQATTQRERSVQGCSPEDLVKTVESGFDQDAENDKTSAQSASLLEPIGPRPDKVESPPTEGRGNFAGEDIQMQDVEKDVTRTQTVAGAPGLLTATEFSLQEHDEEQKSVVEGIDKQEGTRDETNAEESGLSVAPVSFLREHQERQKSTPEDIQMQDVEKGKTATQAVAGAPGLLTTGDFSLQEHDEEQKSVVEGIDEQELTRDKTYTEESGLSAAPVSFLREHHDKLKLTPEGQEAEDDQRSAQFAPLLEPVGPCPDEVECPSTEERGNSVDEDIQMQDVEKDETRTQAVAGAPGLLTATEFSVQEHDGEQKSVVEDGTRKSILQEGTRVTVGKTGVIHMGEEIESGVFCGNFCDKDVVVKRLPCHDLHCQVPGVSLLLEFHHKNIMRYMYGDYDEGFLYIVHEKCDFTLSQFVCDADKKEDLHPIDTMWQITEGLYYLHVNNDLVHGSLSPSNIMMRFQDKHWVVKIAGFDITAESSSDLTQWKEKGSMCYMAPEQIEGKEVSKDTDIFSMGLVSHFIVSDGKHPFGESNSEAEDGIRNEKVLPNLDSIRNEYKHDTSQLISSLISREREQRLAIWQVQAHHLFWDAEKKIHFIQRVSMCSENEKLKGRSLQHLENSWKDLNDDHWRRQLIQGKPELEKVMNETKPLEDQYSLCHLLRVIRNLSFHYYDFRTASELRDELGSYPDGFANLFTSRVPELLPFLYKFMSAMKDEKILEVFYGGKSERLAPYMGTYTGVKVATEDPTRDDRVRTKFQNVMSGLSISKSTTTLLPKQGMVMVGGCSATFASDSFKEATRVTVTAKIDTSEWPKGFEAVAPSIDIDAPGLLKSVRVRLPTWRVNTLGEEVFGCILHKPDGAIEWQHTRATVSITNLPYIEFDWKDFSPVLVAVLSDTPPLTDHPSPPPPPPNHRPAPPPPPNHRPAPPPPPNHRPAPPPNHRPAPPPPPNHRPALPPPSPPSRSSSLEYCVAGAIYTSNQNEITVAYHFNMKLNEESRLFVLEAMDKKMSPRKRHICLREFRVKIGETIKTLLKCNSPSDLKFMPTEPVPFLIEDMGQTFALPLYGYIIGCKKETHLAYMQCSVSKSKPSKSKKEERFEDALFTFRWTPNTTSPSEKDRKNLYA